MLWKAVHHRNDQVSDVTHHRESALVLHMHMGTAYNVIVQMQPLFSCFNTSRLSFRVCCSCSLKQSSSVVIPSLALGSRLLLAGRLEPNYRLTVISRGHID
jgi:hypothetical protein